MIHMVQLNSWPQGKAMAGLLVLLFSAQALSSGVPTVRVDGSSTVFPITEAVAEEFQNSQKGKVRVTVGISGTGGGFKKFCRGETDVQNASRPIQKSEMEDCKKSQVTYYELPIAFDATAVVINPANAWASEISIDELKKMWEPAAQGKIKTWNQINPQWPNAPLNLYGAGADSGTFDYFTEAVVGKAKSSRGDYTASEDDNTLIQGVSRDKNALGYVPFAYYESNKGKLKLVGIKGGTKSPLKDKAVLPSRQTVENGTYYPLSRPIFIYVSEKAAQRSEVMGFANFYLQNASNLVPEVKYVPLPKDAYQLIQGHLAKGKKGTAFGGHSEVGLSIEKLLQKEKSL